MNLPRITLVTPSFNQGQFLEATIQSVLSQNYPNLEYIIMDGGSTDNSVEIIKRYEKYLAYWQSKPDKGQSDALRQGFARATGVLMNWVNSDDLLAPGALDHIASLYNENPGTGIFAGATEHFRKTPADAFKKFVCRDWCPEGFLCCSGHESFAFNQPGAFFTRSLYERIGGLNVDLHLCMDYEMFLKMCETKPKIIYSSQTTAFFRHHALSKTTCGTDKNLIRMHAELLQIFRECSKRTGIVANGAYSSNLIHWLLFRNGWQGNFANVSLAYGALRHVEGRSLWKIVGRNVVLLLRRLRSSEKFLSPEGSCWQA
jgi:glycosyltransferase involved in cell wall biosynthesis